MSNPISGATSIQGAGRASESWPCDSCGEDSGEVRLGSLRYCKPCFAGAQAAAWLCDGNPCRCGEIAAKARDAAIAKAKGGAA